MDCLEAVDKSQNRQSTTLSIRSSPDKLTQLIHVHMYLNI